MKNGKIFYVCSYRTKEGRYCIVSLPSFFKINNRVSIDNCEKNEFDSIDCANMYLLNLYKRMADGAFVENMTVPAYEKEGKGFPSGYYFKSETAKNIKNHQKGYFDPRSEIIARKKIFVK